MADINRLAIQAKLQSFLPSGKKVYFQPPSSVSLTYPCIIYFRHRGESFHSVNRPYVYIPIYDVQVIETDPECPVSQAIGKQLEGSRYDRGWEEESLYHNNFVVNYYHE